MKFNKMASHREFLEQMPTKELDEMLQAELHKDNIDDDLVRLILDVLESREMDYPVENNPEVIEAVQKLEDISVVTASKVKYPRVLKAASILLVVGLLLFALPRAVHAENLFELLARWTDSVFEFFNTPKPNDQPVYVFETDHPGLQQVYDTVVELGVTDPVVPMWLPDGYELKESKLIETPKGTRVFARLGCPTNEMILSIEINKTDVARAYPKDITPVAEFEMHGINHFIFTNREKWIVTWTTAGKKCSFAVDCQEDELYRILKSIYAMGD